MVEYVRTDSDRELEMMAKVQVFEKAEIRGLEKNRKKYEGLITKEPKNSQHYVNYIRSEVDFLGKMRERASRATSSQTYESLYRATVHRINKIYIMGIENIPSDKELITAYVAFSTNLNQSDNIKGMFTRMLKSSSCTPQLYSSAAIWQFMDMGSIENARDFYRQGITKFSMDEGIHLTAFQIELDYIRQTRKDLAGSGPSTSNDNMQETGSTTSDDQYSGSGIPCFDVLDIDSSSSSDKDSVTRNAESVFKSAVHFIPKVEFVSKFLEVTKRYNFTESLDKAILICLLETFKNDELTYEIIGRRALDGLYLPPPVSVPKILKDKINICCSAYIQGIQVIGNEKMWTLYINMLLELSKKPSYPVYKKQLLLKAFEDAHKAGMLEEKFYKIWIFEIQEQAKKKKGNEKLMLNTQVNKILSEATDRYPQSVDLWLSLLRFHMNFGEEKNVVAVFQKAMAAFGLTENSVHIFKIVLQFFQLVNSAKVDQLFIKGIEHGDILALSLKPMYLDWIAVREGISEARSMYEEYCKSEPYCLELHKKMIDLEMIQPFKKITKISNVRSYYNNACEQFGNENPDLWIEYITFENSNGDERKCKDIYKRAIETLAPNHLDSFNTSFNMLKTDLKLIDM